MGHDFGDATDSIWEIFGSRKHGNKCAFGKIAVTDFATSWAAHAVTFADGVARSVVMMHIATFAIGDFHSVDDLGVAEWSESNDVESLGHATSKDGRTMSAGQYASLGAEWANFVKFATIWANVFLNNTVAGIVMDGELKCTVVFVAEMLIVIFDLSGEGLFRAHLFGDTGFFVGDKFAREFIVHGIFDITNQFVAFGSIGTTDISAKLAANPLVDSLLDIFIWENEGILAFDNANFFTKLLLEFDGWLDGLQCPFETLDNDFFGDFVSTGFDHGDTTVFARDYEVEVGCGAFFWGQKGFVFAIDAADTDASDRAIKWYAGKIERSRSGNHGDGIGSEIWVQR